MTLKTLKILNMQTMKAMTNNTKNGLLVYALDNDITAFTTDRTVGRDPEKIKTLVAGIRNIPVETIRYTRPHQTHTDRVMPVAEEFFALSPQTQQMLMEGVDAVTTKVSNVVMGVSTADCIPVIVYDHEHHAAAAIHAGWRGTVQSIVLKTIEQMRQMYHTDPTQCKAVIGPGISLDSFEVGDEVYNAFVEAQFPMDDFAQQYPAFTHDGEVPQQPVKWHIDLKEINRQQLMMTGVKAENIMVSDIDTFTDARFFSARREQKGDEKCGRIFTGFMIN